MRTFHIGGTASKRVEQTTIEARNAGTVSFEELKTVQNAEGHSVVMNRNGEIAILGKGGREVERYPIIYGAVLKVRTGRRSRPTRFWPNGTPSIFPS